MGMKEESYIEQLDYVFEHVGEGKFKCIKSNGDKYDVGSNIVGMIRYSFFEDFTLPEIGWRVTQRRLTEVHLSKMVNDLKSGKIKKDKDGIYREGYE